MSIPMDQMKMGFGTALIDPDEYDQEADGLGAALLGLSPPFATHVPGYIDSRDGKTFIPLLPGVSPAAFAAQQQSGLENLAAGYGDETQKLGKGVKDFVESALSQPTEPNDDTDADIEKGLYRNSAAAKWGRFGADIVNTYPIAMAGGELAAPAARLIGGDEMLPTLARTMMKNAAQGFATGLVLPANSGPQRLTHALTGAAFGGSMPFDVGRTGLILRQSAISPLLRHLYQDQTP